MKPVKNILYIHGYKSELGGQSFKLFEKYTKEVEDYDIVMHEIDYKDYDPDSALRNIHDYVFDNNIDLIIGSSLGGFLTLNCFDIPRIVINPCLKPSEELPKLGYTGSVKKYETLERNVEHYRADNIERLLCKGCFADDDEIFGTKFKSQFQKMRFKTYEIDGGHRVSEKSVKLIMIFIVPEFFKELKKINIALDDQMNSDLFDD